MVCDGRYKSVVHGHAIGRLYDLARDPGEFDNQKIPSRVQRPPRRDDGHDRHRGRQFVDYRHCRRVSRAGSTRWSAMKELKTLSSGNAVHRHDCRNGSAAVAAVTAGARARPTSSCCCSTTSACVKVRLLRLRHRDADLRLAAAGRLSRLHTTAICRRRAPAHRAQPPLQRRRRREMATDFRLQRTMVPRENGFLSEMVRRVRATFGIGKWHLTPGVGYDRRARPGALAAVAGSSATTASSAAKDQPVGPHAGHDNLC